MTQVFHGSDAVPVTCYAVSHGRTAVGRWTCD